MADNAYRKQLDDALKYLRDNIAIAGTFLYYEKHKADSNRQAEYLYKHFKETEVKETFWLPMIYYLKEDGCIDVAYDPPEHEIKKMPPNQLKITFKGLMFLDDGGYEGQYQRMIADQKARNDYQEKAETLATGLRDWTRILAVRTNELKNWTRAVAIGAIGLVLWEIAAYLLEHCF